jgi:hypothetical protein
MRQRPPLFLGRPFLRMRDCRQARLMTDTMRRTMMAPMAALMT